MTQTYLNGQPTTAPGASRVASAARAASFKRACGSSTAESPDCRPWKLHRTLFFWASELTAIQWRPDLAQCEKLLANMLE
jgi:hypothetical protein